MKRTTLLSLILATSVVAAVISLTWTGGVPRPQLAAAQFLNLTNSTSNIYVNCSTGVSPPTTVGPDSSAEQQVTCNAGDAALGGGIEVLSPSLPLPPGVLVTTPENSFLFSGESPVGWQVVVQNTNLNPYCGFPRAPAVLCPSIQYRVCVSCVTQRRVDPAP